VHRLARLGLWGFLLGDRRLFGGDLRWRVVLACGREGDEGQEREDYKSVHVGSLRRRSDLPYQATARRTIPPPRGCVHGMIERRMRLVIFLSTLMVSFGAARARADA